MEVDTVEEVKWHTQKRIEYQDKLVPLRERER
jgi:hypothetical protein